MRLISNLKNEYIASKDVAFLFLIPVIIYITKGQNRPKIAGIYGYFVKKSWKIG